jgi:putative ABC transport system permease protein
MGVESLPEIPVVMLRNYLKTALRSFRRNKSFSFINVAGLAIGLTCFVLIGVFVVDELSYDKYAKNANDIYRIHLDVTGNGDIATYPSVDSLLGRA